MAKKISNIEEAENIEENKEEKIIVEKPTSKRYKTEKCKVLSYNDKSKELDIDFKGYGIRLNNINNIQSDFVTVKYYGEIGKSTFSCEL